MRFVSRRLQGNLRGLTKMLFKARKRLCMSKSRDWVDGLLGLTCWQMQDHEYLRFLRYATCSELPSSTSTYQHYLTRPIIRDEQPNATAVWETPPSPRLLTALHHATASRRFSACAVCEKGREYVPSLKGAFFEMKRMDESGIHVRPD